MAYDGTKVAIYSVVMLTVSIFTLMVCDNADAQVNEKTLESVALPTGISEGVAEIKTGKSPVYVYGDLTESDAIYVANSESDSISVVNITTNAVMKTIPVGFRPNHIYGDILSNLIYVANSGVQANNVSVIDTEDNTVINNIPVGNGSTYIYGDITSPLIYVSNSI